MKVSILSIGDELLKGSTVNTNLSNLGQMLLKAGIMIEREMCVKDVYQDITDACDVLFRNTDVIITTGGLGPTADDITKKAIADRLGMELVKSKEVEERILNFYKRTGRKMSSPKVLNQTLIPKGAKILDNENGTAPGLIISLPDKSGKYIIMLPGPPREALPMFEKEVISFLLEINDKKVYSECFVVAGVPESKVELMLASVVDKLEEYVRFAFCASPGKVKIFFLSEDKTAADTAVEEAKKIFGENILMHGTEIAEDVSALLKRKNLSLAVAESCTGGMIGGKLTAIPGSSDFFSGGIIAYSNDIKIKLLGVSEYVIKKYGAVSEQCAWEMVNCVCEKFKTDTGIAVTGIAGPGGGTPDKPAGTVYTGTRYADKIIVKHHIFRGDRNSVRERAAQSTLNQLRLMLL